MLAQKLCRGIVSSLPSDVKEIFRFLGVNNSLILTRFMIFGQFQLQCKFYWSQSVHFSTVNSLCSQKQCPFCCWCSLKVVILSCPLITLFGTFQSVIDANEINLMATLWSSKVQNTNYAPSNYTQWDYDVIRYPNNSSMDLLQAEKENKEFLY